MANIVITNNGNDSVIPAQYDEQGNEIAPAQPIDPILRVTGEGGQFLIKPNTSMGLAHGSYTIEVI
jgi:hypothetical protein